MSSFRFFAKVSLRAAGISALLILCGSAQILALEIKEIRWGFDGRVLPGHFNILSVRIANSASSIFEGELALDEMRGEDHVGASLVEPLYLGPHSERVIQFVPLVTQEGDWRLHWNRRAEDRKSVDGPRFGGPARVILTEPESFRPNALRAFPEDLFPISVAATDGLDAVVLDHVPRWEAMRREALLAWLRLGGTVHVARAANGEHPQFSGELEILNTPAERTRFGSGWILRHDVSAAEIDEAFLAQHGSPERTLRQGQRVMVYNFDNTLLQRLAGLTQPEIAWWLIYLLTVSYILVVGVGQYLWARKVDYRASIFGFLGVVALYAVAFAYAGRRGASESGSVHSVAFAQSLGDDQWDVTQWVSAFVTRGNTYNLTHAAPANFYSVAPQSEEVNGQIHNGRNGLLRVDMPLFSSRPFVHRGVLHGAETNVTVDEWETDDAGMLRNLALRPGPGFPAGIDKMWVRQAEHFYAMSQTGALWKLSGPGKSAETFFDAKDFQELNIYHQPRRIDARERIEWMAKISPLLLAHALGGAEQFQHVIPGRPMAGDQAQLFVFASAPEGFRLQGGDFRKQSGLVIYQQDLFKP